MSNATFSWLVALCCGAAAGYFFGRSTASEHFYDTCLGGEVTVGSSVGSPKELIGCAEIARNIR